ncbi:MAG: LamG domain-containing protein [Kiritimatiellaeota bacterium]|nr:LamG domain-containing protein [Kiritimatiellota bacterium]
MHTRPGGPLHVPRSSLVLSLMLASCEFRAAQPSPPAADAPTVMRLRFNSLPLTDTGPLHLRIRSRNAELDTGVSGRALVSRAGGGTVWVVLPAGAQPTHSLKLECRFRIDSIGTEKVQWVAARNAMYGFFVSGKPGAARLTWYLKLRGGAWNALTTPAPLGKWLRAVGAFDGKRTVFFLNDRKVGEKSCPGVLPTGRNPLVIGADEKGRHRFTGRVDEVRLTGITGNNAMPAAPRPSESNPIAQSAKESAHVRSAQAVTTEPDRKSTSATVIGPPVGGAAGNLLKNPLFAFHAFANHRLGKAVSYESHNVAFWNTDAWGDITVVREANAPDSVRPSFSTGALVRIEPGKEFRQFFTLPEAGLAHGESVSLHVFAHQSEPNALAARIRVLKLDSEDGTWRPADYGMSDKRTFPRHARGELVTAELYRTSVATPGAVELRIAGARIPGRFHRDSPSRSYSDDINTVGVQVEFANTTADGVVWVWWPSLCAGPRALPRLRSVRSMKPWYRYIPRTVQKLWKGESLHIIVMGSSIDRGSANPPMYLYDENPASPTFKQPLSDRTFEPGRVGRPDLDGYVGWWQHYWNYAGRLRLELMRKFNLPVNKLCLNFMACDGSCIGEAHSGLEAYCSLSLPPSPGVNGQSAGKTWRQLHPDLFRRPEGPGPDLVILGSGANEKTDTPDEVAVFEGTIRWIQRHYPHTEFIFCMFQNHGGYTPNSGDLQALSLRYGIPMLDAGKVLDDATRWCNRYALVPRDGHPQAAAHYLWFKTLEKAFECWDPVVPGIPQQYLPERLHSNTYGWEGEMVQFDKNSPRIHGNMFIFEDTAINCWGGTDSDIPVPLVDGLKQDSRRSSPRRDLRNSMFRWGRTSLGDRHVLEVTGKRAYLSAVDAKVCPNRRFFDADNPCWRPGNRKVEPFESKWGAPYGARFVRLQPGQTLEADVTATDLSVAYLDAPGNGKLRIEVDGVEKLVVAADQPYKDATGKNHYMEDRRGIRGLPWGLHTVRIQAVDAPVSVLGLFVYDSRPNRRAERAETGLAAPGETVIFTAPFRARPVVFCDGGLVVRVRDIRPDRVTFAGTGPGAFRALGE